MTGPSTSCTFADPGWEFKSNRSGAALSSAALWASDRMDQHKFATSPEEMTMAPRILILSASVGAGHLRAAEAVELALRETHPEATVRNLDVLELTNRVFRRFYAQFYLDLVNKAPHVLGYFYDMLDQPSRSGRNRGDRFRLMLEKMNLKKFSRSLLLEPWVLFINTHFLPAETIRSLR